MALRFSGLEIVDYLLVSLNMMLLYSPLSLSTPMC